MKKFVLVGSILIGALLLAAGSLVAADRPIAPNGIAIYPDYMSWKAVAPSYRESIAEC